MKFIKDTFHSALGVSAKVVGSLTLNKFFAVYFGTAGVTLLAHFQNLTAMLTQVPVDGINRGIMRYWAISSVPEKFKTEIFFAGFLINLVVYTLAVAGLLLFSPHLSEILAGEVHGTLFYLCFFGSIFVFVVNLMLQCLVLAAHRYKDYSLLQLSNTSILVVSVLFSFARHEIGSSFLAFSLGMALGVVPTIIYLYKYPILSFHGFSVSAKSFKSLNNFVLMALSVLVFGKLMDFMVRDFAIHHFGLEATGLWQSVVKVSDMYMMLFISVVGTVYYPSVSALVFEPDQLKKYVRDALKILIPLISIGFFIMYLIKDWILGILYTHEFLGASVFFPYQLIGDFFGMISFLLAYIISAQARTIAYMAVQAFSALIYGLMIWLLLNDWGIMSFPMAHMCRHILFFLLLLGLNRRILH